MTKYVYAFEEGNKNMRDLLGGKGANLAEMINLGLPIPNGFTITTEACKKYYEDGEVISKEILNEVEIKLKEIEKKTGKKMGDKDNPLLVSVRSGAKFSMPGMMDTVLNIGLNDEVVQGLINKTNNARFAYDSYRRLIQMFADVVMGYSRLSFEEILDKIKTKKGVSFDTDLDEKDMQKVCEEYKKLYQKLNGEPFPKDPKVQLFACIKAVFKSWNNERAITYRRLNDIPEDLGTAVNVQEMVYGNYGDNSATGVAFTRNPSTGEKKLYGEYLVNAQGEDVVAGIRTPQSIETLKEIMPELYEQFCRYSFLLEEHYKDMQDIEFTIEDGKLYILQTRNGKRTAMAAIKIAVDLVNEKKITKEEAILRVEPKQLDQLLHDTFDKESLKNSKVIGKGLAASPGAATGKIYFDADDVVEANKNGEKEIILVRVETSPEDIEGMNLASGILTMRGGMTSHAAVVARGMGKCCVVGCGDLVIDEKNKTMISGSKKYKEGDYISIDGTTGYVYDDKLKTVEPSLSGEFGTFMKWVDDYRKLKVRTNADTPKDAMQAIKFGAEGIGLCRTEHMFFAEDRILAVRQMIVSETKEQREKVLNKLLPYQRNDFEEIFKVMKGLPITIRYLDPPLHEFLPKEKDEIKHLADSLKISYKELNNRIESLKEFNPMMGHRGCRLAVSYPEIAEMQTKAVIEAAINVKKKKIDVDLEIMIPLISDIKELKYVKDIIVKTADKLIKEHKIPLSYKIGTMIEVPRACVIADIIAKEVDFFSFGTNDLTQMTYAFSRDDTIKFLEDYFQKNLFAFDPFAKLDQTGVGELVKMGIEKGRKTKPNLKIGVCGEHGGDPSSIEFFHNVGMDYVSCSPYRIPIARLAIAQAAIKAGMDKK